MPQLAIAVIVGAGLMAGYKWIARELQRQSDSAETARAEAETHASVGPRDLGALEWDEASGVYKPRQG
jgi:prephenate dehydrogenase